MYQQPLQEHIDDKKAYGEKPQPPATAAQLQALRDRARKELGADLPKEYYELLQTTNGLDSNGLVIYASETGPIAGYEGKDMSIEGIVDANLGWWELEAHKRFIFFGESSSGRYVYDQQDKKYRTMDRQSTRLVDEFPSFEAMMQRALEENHP